MAPKREEAMAKIIRTLDHLQSDFDYCCECLYHPVEALTHQAVKVQHSALEPMLAKYQELHVTLSQYIVGEDWQPYKEKYETFRSQYYTLLTKVHENFAKFEANLSSQTLHNTTLNNDSTSNAGRKRSVLKTPKINNPEYDGTPEKWIKFRDLFESMIHKQDFDNIEKFHYLEMALTKIPKMENPLSDYSINADNYEDAWKAVCRRYDDKRKILAIHLDALFAVTPIKSESAKEIRRILDTFTSNLSALKQCGFVLSSNDDLANLIIVHMATTKLDSETLKDWRKFQDEDTSTWAELHDFLVAQWRSLDDIRSTKNVPARAKVEVKLSEKPSKTFQTSTQSPKSNQVCSFCGDSHTMWNCSLTPQEKYKAARTKNLCLNCLNNSHQHKDCTSKSRCKTCNKPHHTLLHFNRDTDTKTENNQQSPSTSTQPGSNSTLSPNVPTFKPYTMTKTMKTNAVIEDWNQANTGITMTSATDTASQLAILSTISVGVMASDGCIYSCRALLDSGSDSNFMSTALANHLKLPLNPICVPLVGINNKTTIIRSRTSTTIASHYGPYQRTLQFNVMPRLTGNIPSGTMDINMFSEIPSDYHLADPRFNVKADVDLLLNSEVFFDSLLPDKLVLNNGAILLHSTFGWIVGGSVPLASTSLLSSVSNCAKTGFEDIDNKLDQFFRAEEIQSTIKLPTTEEKFCEDLFRTTTTRGSDGKFVVQMPFKEGFENLGNNLANSTRQSFMQETRRKKDDVYNKLYSEYMLDYENSGHMTQVKRSPDHQCHYLPHHGVVKMSSTTTKLRAVFNASSKSENGLSLNDVLCVGPTVQSESFDILMRFREKLFAMTGDIEKMYLQVWIHPSQRDFLRLVWRKDTTTPLLHYRMNTVTFGTACAPFLATNCLRQLAIDHRDSHPEASAIIESSFYVDDLLCGFDTLIEGLNLRDQIRDILTGAGMSLRKISANHPALYLDLAEDEKLPTNKNNSVTKTLGIAYCASKDEFSYTLKPMKPGIITKSSVLSEIASIFDPIGWLGPVILKAKFFMKLLWQHKINWTDQLSDDLQEQWNLFRENFHQLNHIIIKRHCFIPNHVQIEIHGFCDASIHAYGATIYALSYDSIGNHQVSLLCAKSRVSPTRQISLPRLELCGATLLAKLNMRIQGILTCTITSVTLWSDSSIVLHWISMESTRLMTYVGNRVSQIQQHSHQFTWKHIEGINNPADVISRGLDPSELEDCDIWWRGPSFFSLPQSQWPQSIITLNEHDPQVLEEVKKSTFSVRVAENNIFTVIESRFSKLKRLLNVLAYVLRFTHNTRHVNRLSGALSGEETEKALIIAVKTVQQSYFPQEYSILSSARRECQQTTGSSMALHTTVAKQSSIISLSPYMDDDGILRVAGRVQECSKLNIDQKHQMILPPCHLSLLIVREIHQKQLHPGILAMKAFIRQRFWITRSRDVITKVARECLTCFRVKPIETQQFMANLPGARVNMTSPFQNTALDYAGFYIIKTGTTRNAPKAKAYIAMFKCMCTGAIHLELASELSSQAFFSVLDRFISRRGICEELFLDNATAFHGADNDLRKIIENQAPEIKQYCTDVQIKFHFTTPRAPHAGGIYESGIKSMKHHLKRVLDERPLTFEQFSTVLCKIEAVLNSRPLTPISEDAKDFEVLTPGHFLIFRPLNARPERNFINNNANHLDRWKVVQQIQQKFWSLWYQDYLHQLQTRPNNFRQKFEFRIGDLVLLKDSNLPPMKWLAGRVTQLFPGKDGIIRNVRVNTKNGEKDRHVKYLCFLPMSPS